MGLESHITQLLDSEPAAGLRYGYEYWFDDGLMCKDILTAEKVEEQLFESGQFGDTTLYPQLDGTVKIAFKPFLWRK